MSRVLLLGLWVGATSCYHATYSTGAPRATAHPAAEGMNHFFLWGLANSGTVNAAGYCGAQGAAKVDVYESFVDGLLHWVTAGIYCPRTYKVWCAKPVDPPVAPVTPGEEVSP